MSPPEAQTAKFHDSCPVDIRHNAKIEREALVAWAARRPGRSAAPPVKAWLLRLVPLAGWLFLLYGYLFPFQSLLLRTAWGIDLFLSVVVHGLQLFTALPIGRAAGYSRRATVFYTFLFGATWWKLLPSTEQALEGAGSGRS